MPLFDLTPLALSAIAIAAFLAAVLHGSVGLAGGIVLTAVLANVLGIKLAIPVVTVALIFSHGSRVFLHLKQIDWPSVKIVLLFSLPTIVFGAAVFTVLPSSAVAVIMAVFLSLSIPIKRWAKHHQLKTTTPMLAVASSAWGMLAGNVVGPGFVLAPFLLGRGMGRMSFVGSLALIVLSMNICKLLVFGGADLLEADVLLLGILLGLVSIPGNAIGKLILTRMTDKRHDATVDFLTLLLIANFAYLAVFA